MSETRQEIHVERDRENAENLKRLAMKILAHAMPIEMRTAVAVSDLNTDEMRQFIRDAADVIEYLRDELQKAGVE